MLHYQGLTATGSSAARGVQLKPSHAVMRTVAEMASTRQLRVAFVMEQALGHVTVYQNLRKAVGTQERIAPTWLPLSFEPAGLERYVPLLNSNWSARASWRARRALANALSREQHDAVLFHTQVTSLFSTDVMRRVPTVISLDATPIGYDSIGAHYGHKPAGAGPVDRVKYRLNRAAFHAARRLVTWSDWARRSLMGDYGVDSERIRVIAPGAAKDYFEIGRRRVESSAEPTNDGTGPAKAVRVLFVGGDFARKGGPELLACMSGALAERCELHIVTKAEIEPQPNVIVHRGLGPNSPELLRLFAEADVFVLPSHADCLAVVLMEATAAALPVITTDVGALREAVINGESGLLIAPGDVGALRAALETLVFNEQLRRRLGCTGHRLACQQFDAQENSRALLDQIQIAAEDGRGETRHKRIWI